MTLLNRILGAAALILFATSATPQTPTPNRGTQIGSIISGAIDTALPGVTKLTTALLDIFKPKPADVPAKSTAIKNQIDASTVDLKNQIKDQFKTAEPLAIQLDTLGPFLEYGFRASNELSKLMVYVSSTPNPSSAQFTSAKAQWSKVKGALAQIAINSADVQAKVKSEELQQLLLQILEAKAVTSSAIDVLFASRPPSGFPMDLPSELSELSQTLSTLNVVSRIQLNSLSGEVHGLVAWAKVATTLPTTVPTVAQGSHDLPSEIQEDQQTASAILQHASKQR